MKTIQKNQKIQRFKLSDLSMEKLKQSFGTLKLKKPIQEIMDEIDEGYD